MVETDDGWFRANVLDRWPTQTDGRKATLGNTQYTRDEDYTARVTYAAGAFNWRVQAGDQTRVVEYTAGQESLAAESDAHELSWSRSTPVSTAQIKAWFGKVVAEPVKDVSASGYMTVAVVSCVLLGLLNLVPFFMAPGSVFVITFFAALMLIVPAWLVAKVGGGE